MGIFDFLSPDVPSPQPIYNQIGEGTEFLKKSLKKGAQDINTGFDEAKPSFQSVIDLYAGMGGQDANDMYLNSLGLKGDEGYNTALGAFNRTNQANEDAGIQAFMRNQASLGNVGSGASAEGLYDLGRKYFSQDFGNWQNQLSGLGQRGTVGQAQGLTNLGNLTYGRGTDLANNRAAYAGPISGQYNNMAQAMGQYNSQLMGAEQAGIGNALGLIGGFTGMLGGMGQGGMFNGMFGA